MKPMLKLLDKTWEALRASNAKQALSFYQTRNPELDLRCFANECLNAIVYEGPEFTMKHYDVGIGFMQNLEKFHLKYPH